MSPSRPTEHEVIRLHEDQASLFGDRYRAQQNDPYHSSFNYGRKKLAEVMFSALGERGADRIVLDAGCGTGFFLGAFEARRFRVIGIDLAWNMLMRAREDRKRPVIYGDVRALPFPAAAFDAVVSVEVVRYLRDAERAIEDYVRVLRPGGLCVVTAAPRFSTHGYAAFNRVNAALGLTSRIKARQYFETTSSLRRKMTAAGLIDVKVSARFLGPFIVAEKIAPALIPRMLRYWEPFDDRLSNRTGFQNLSNHIIAVGRKPSAAGTA